MNRQYWVGNNGVRLIAVHKSAFKNSPCISDLYWHPDSFAIKNSSEIMRAKDINFCQVKRLTLELKD